MLKQVRISLLEDEEYPVYSVSKIVRELEPTGYVSADTLERWNRVEEEYDQAQNEMRELFDKWSGRT